MYHVFYLNMAIGSSGPSHWFVARYERKAVLADHCTNPAVFLFGIVSLGAGMIKNTICIEDPKQVKSELLLRL